MFPSISRVTVAAFALAINTIIAFTAHAGSFAEAAALGAVDTLWRPYAGRLAILMGCVAAGVLVAWIRERNRIAADNACRVARVNAIEAQQLSLRTLGDASEQQVGQGLLDWCREVDPDASLATGVILSYPDSRPGQMSRFEVDCLLLTRFGIFVVEVKNWKHPVSITSTGWSLKKPDGPIATTSPLQQNRPKVTAIQNALRADHGDCRNPVYNVVILSHAQASLPMRAPAEAMTMDEARLFLRQAFHRAQENGIPAASDVQQAARTIAAMKDQRADVKHHFLLELNEKKGQAADYARLEREKRALLVQPAAAARPLRRCVWTYLPTVCFLLVTSCWPSHLIRMPEQSSTVAMLQPPSASASHASVKARLPHRKGRNAARQQ